MPALAGSNFLPSSGSSVVGWGHINIPHGNGCSLSALTSYDREGPRTLMRTDKETNYGREPAVTTSQ